MHYSVVVPAKTGAASGARRRSHGRLLTGLVLGSLRFVLEVVDKGSHFEGSAVRWLLDMNFLHYAILMFVVCCVVLVAVSLLTPAPERRKLAGLTFATVDEKMDTQEIAGAKVALARESPLEHKLNVAFSLLRIASVVGLWIYFRATSMNSCG